MTVDQKVTAFLKRNKGKWFCDACIPFHVKRPDGQSINHYQASNATRPLAESSDFEQGGGRCSNCRKALRKVTGAIRN